MWFLFDLLSTVKESFPQSQMKYLQESNARLGNRHGEGDDGQDVEHVEGAGGEVGQVQAGNNHEVDRNICLRCKLGKGTLHRRAHCQRTWRKAPSCTKFIENID